MEILATFTGKDGSLGYKHGNDYFLKIFPNNSIVREDGSGYCFYESIGAFLDNWTDIRTDQDIIKTLKLAMDFNKNPVTVTTKLKCGEYKEIIPAEVLKSFHPGPGKPGEVLCIHCNFKEKEHSVEENICPRDGHEAFQNFAANMNRPIGEKIQEEGTTYFLPSSNGMTPGFCIYCGMKLEQHQPNRACYKIHGSLNAFPE